MTQRSPCGTISLWTRVWERNGERKLKWIQFLNRDFRDGCKSFLIIHDIWFFLREASRENRWSYFYASSPSPDSAVPLNQIPKWFSSAAFLNETTKKAKICDSRREPSSTPFFLALSLSLLFFLTVSLSLFRFPLSPFQKKKSICPVCSQENGLTRICSCFVLFSLSEKAKMQTTHIQKTRNVWSTFSC